MFTYSNDSSNGSGKTGGFEYRAVALYIMLDYCLKLYYTIDFNSPLGMNPDADTSFLPDVDREALENKMRQVLILSFHYFLNLLLVSRPHYFNCTRLFNVFVYTYVKHIT